MDTRRRRHQRLFRDYSVHRFRRVFHHTQHKTHHTPHTHITGTLVDTRRRRHQQPFRDYSAHRFRRVCHHTHNTRHTRHHTHTSQVFGWTPGDEGTNDYFATIPPIGFAVYFATHTTQDTPHTTHTHTHHRYLCGHHATKAPTTILRLFCLTFRRVFRVAKRSHITTHRAQH